MLQRVTYSFIFLYVSSLRHSMDSTEIPLSTFQCRIHHDSITLCCFLYSHHKFWLKFKHELYCQWKKVHWLMYLLINFCWVSCMWVNNSGLKAMHEPYKSNDILCKTPLVYKQMQPTKEQSCLEVNAWTDWWQQGLILEYSIGLAYWIH